MVTKFEELVNGMVNIGFGVAATAAERGREGLEDLNTKGAEVRSDANSSDFARSMSDAFERAGGVFTETTERLAADGSTAAERVLDELIVARLRMLDAPERAAFLVHVGDLVTAVESETVSIPVEAVEGEADREEDEKGE